jgi:hypothetical protein
MHRAALHSLLGKRGRFDVNCFEIFRLRRLEQVLVGGSEPHYFAEGDLETERRRKMNGVKSFQRMALNQIASQK